MAGLFGETKKPKLPPVVKAPPPPEVTEDVEEDAARRLRRRGKAGGFAGTLVTGEPLGSKRKSFLG